jgi:superfamily II DNA/RNA helicase
MHEVLVRQLAQKKDWSHVLFHGGVPSVKRKDLIDRFRDDPKCRLFLSTDAGGVGLNLQFASVVINMDLPWNPAVLEQRIGRVHRLGQKRSVQVINFVARGTIEEGMLGVIKFKKSLFAGVLDGGEKDVMFGGTRLTKFMESVEETTKAIPAAVAVDETASRERQGPQRAASNEALSTLVQSGITFLQQLATVAQNGNAQANPLIGRDENTGQEYLKLPMPDPATMQQLMAALGALLPRS